MRIPWHRLPSFPLLFVVFMSVFVLLFDVFTLGPMLRQVLTVRYARTMGTIVRGEVEERADREDGSTSYSFSVLYRYEVDGRLFESSTVSHSPAQEFSSAYSLQERFPEGSTVPVFYRPGNPARAVLQKGLRRGDVFLLLFMTPFNLLVLIGWDQAARARRQRQSVHSFIVKGRTHVSLAVTGTLGATLYGLWFANFVAVGVAFPSGFESSWRLLGGCWAAVGLTGVATALWYGAKLHAGEFDLILDERKERLSVPAMFDRSERLELKLGQVLSVTIEEHIEKNHEGHPVSRWRPTLTFSTGPGESASVPLAHYVDSHRAEVLVFWLRRRLRLERGGQPVSATQAA